MKKQELSLLSDEELKSMISRLAKNLSIVLTEEAEEKIKKAVRTYYDKALIDFKKIKNVECSEYRIEAKYILYGEIDILLEDDDSIEIVDFKTGSYAKESVSKYKEQLAFYSLILKDKTKKHIKKSLYYLWEEEPYINLDISEEELEEYYKNIEKTIADIINQKFEKIDYDDKKCPQCEFSKYCINNLGEG